MHDQWCQLREAYLCYVFAGMKRFSISCHRTLTIHSNEQSREEYTPATMIFPHFHRPQHLVYEALQFFSAEIRKNPNPGALFLSIDRFNPPYRLLIADLAQVALGGGQVRVPKNDLADDFQRCTGP